MNRLHVYVILFIDIKPIEAATSSNDILLLYKYHKRIQLNPIDLDIEFYTLSSEAGGARIQGEERKNKYNWYKEEGNYNH